MPEPMSSVKPPRPPVDTRRWAQPGSRSAELFARAQGVMPGGNTRTSVFMPPYPPYALRGEGCWVIDADGDRRLDFLNNYTTLIHGHAHPNIIEAVTAQLARGASFALPTSAEIELAALLVDRIPSAERIRFTNSGTEAVMMAIKGARAYTGRAKIAKFEGAYHGSYDYAEVSLSSEAANWGSLESPASVPYCRATPASVLEDVVVLPFNRTQEAVARIEREAKHLAAVLIDPLPSWIGLVPGRRDFLEAIREVTRAHGIVLIFDEVMCFRIGYHGAQGVLGVTPDVTTLGKIIGGGFPIGAVAGPVDLMAVFDPTRGGRPPVPHAGTFNANPVTMAAGLAAMQMLDRAQYDRLSGLGDRLRVGVNDCFKRARVVGQVTGLGSLFKIHVIDREPSDFRATLATPSELDRKKRITRGLVERGVLIAPTGLGCLSTPMGQEEVETFLETFAAVLAGLD